MIPRLEYRGELAHPAALAERLAPSGLSPAACRQKAVRFAQAAAALSDFSTESRCGRTTAFFVPGRIEVLGKHTDYAGGQTMVAAVEQGFSLVVRPRPDRQVRLVDVAARQTVQFELEPGLQPAAGHWSNYPMTVARRIARNFPGAVRGADIAFASDLPAAAGMSSSSAMIVAVFLALAEVNHLAQREEFRRNIGSLLDLAGYLGTVENGQTFGSLEGDFGVGTFGGSEDHTAILTARPEHVSQYSYCPVRFQRAIPLPAGATFAVGVSGVAAEKTGAAMRQYNAASRRASTLVELWRRHTGRTDPHLAAVLAAEPMAAERLAGLVRAGVAETAGARADELLARLEHFLVENQHLVPAAGDALARGDLDAFADLVDRSQHAAENLLGNQVPETSYLAASARRLGALAASAFGAGFGGSVWALVEKTRVGPFLARWGEDYRRRYPQRVTGAAFFVAGAGPAAFQLCEAASGQPWGEAASGNS